MTGEAHWFGLMFSLLGVLALGALYLYERREESRYRAESHRWYCVAQGREVDLVQVADAATGRWLGVRSCSAFSDPERVVCDKHCVAELNSGLIRLVPLHGARG